MDFTGKKVVVSGGIGGIGFEACSQLIRQGIKCLAILDIVNDGSIKLNQLKSINNNVNILYFKIDVTNKNEVDSTFKEIDEQFKSIDIYIGIAGILNESKIEDTVNINFLGNVYTTSAAMKVMSKENGRNGGVIAAVASIAGIEPFYYIPVYVASKHALVGYMRCYSNDYFYNIHGIKFITICPGLTETPLVDQMDTKTVSDDVGKRFVTEVKMFPLNSAADMGKLVVDCVKVGNNGSIWITDSKQIKEVEMKHYWP